MGTSVQNFFTDNQKEEIKQAIMNAELETSGEIRVHIENKCKGDVIERASYVFKRLEVHKTELKNGVLFYLAIKNRKFAVLGDKGINEVVPEDFWDQVKFDMLNHFREEKFTDGLVEAITTVGSYLKEHFPYQKDDINELTDEISFGDK